MIDETIHSLRLPYPGREDRLVRAFVPAHAAGETLPVVYMTDGQNLFDEQSSGFGCWHTREAVRAERAATGRAAVIVGVHNVDPWRTSELTPASIGPLALPPGAPPELFEKLVPTGEVFDDFLLRTVMPAVEARFPVKPGRAHTAVCGSSSGGLQAFFTALSHPDRFCAAGVFSPAFVFYAPQTLAAWIRAKRSETPPFLYLYTGAGEPLERDICESTVQAAAVLRSLWPEPLYRELVVPEAIHHETAWEPRFREFLSRFLSRSFEAVEGSDPPKGSAEKTV